VSLRSLPDRITVYNFEVEHDHTYFVGHEAAWVHNACTNPLGVGSEVLVPRTGGAVSGGRVVALEGDRAVVEVLTADGQVGTKVVARDVLTPRRNIGDQVLVPRSDGSQSIATVVERRPDGSVRVQWDQNGQIAEKTIHEGRLADVPAATRRFGDPYVSAEQGYFRDRLFSDYIPGELPTEGWKLHVSADPSRSYEVADRVLPMLREMGVPHKVMTDPAAYAQMTGGQAGKFITIYPRSSEEAAQLARVIDGRMAGMPAGPVIQGERGLGQSGSVYTRYGGFTKSTVTDPATGAEVGDMRGRISPPWIQDPFSAFGL